MPADLSNDVDAVFISKNDRLYRPPYARERNTTAYNNYVPYFICSVSCCPDEYAFQMNMLCLLYHIILLPRANTLLYPWSVSKSTPPCWWLEFRLRGAVGICKHVCTCAAAARKAFVTQMSAAEGSLMSPRQI